MIGDANSRPLYLVIAPCLKDGLNKKIKAGTVSSNDFITLRAKHNDATVSFFPMLKDVPHGEAFAKREGNGASFYVTAGRDLPNADTNMENVELLIEE